MSSALKYFIGATELKVADAEGYNTDTKSHLASGNTVAVWKLWTDMKKLETSPSHHTYHSLPHPSAQSKDRRAVWRCIAQMSNDEWQSTIIPCTILFKLIMLSVCTQPTCRI